MCVHLCGAPERTALYRTSRLVDLGRLVLLAIGQLAESNCLLSLDARADLLAFKVCSAFLKFKVRGANKLSNNLTRFCVPHWSPLDDLLF